MGSSISMRWPWYLDVHDSHSSNISRTKLITVELARDDRAGRFARSLAGDPGAPGRITGRGTSLDAEGGSGASVVARERALPERAFGTASGGSVVRAEPPPLVAEAEDRGAECNCSSTQPPNQPLRTRRRGEGRQAA